MRQPRKKKTITERVGEPQACRQKNQIAYLNAGTRHLVPIAAGSIPPENLLGSVSAPDGIINPGSSLDGATREFFQLLLL